MTNPITLSSFVTAARQNEGRLVVKSDTVSASANLGPHHVVSETENKRVAGENVTANNEFVKVMEQSFGEKIAGQAIGTALQNRSEALTGRIVTDIYQRAKTAQDEQEKGIVQKMREKLVSLLGYEPESAVRKEWGAVKTKVNVARDRSDTIESHKLHDIVSFATFEPKGVKEAAAVDFLYNHPDGRLLMTNIARNTADWDNPDNGNFENRNQKRLGIALGQVMSGKELPTRLHLNVGDELVKITKRGVEASAYSPYFTTRAALEEAIATVGQEDQNKSIAAVFGLPLGSIDANDVYDVHVIRVTQATDVLTSTVAPTEEIGGEVTTPGGAMQILMSRADAENVTTTIKERADTSGVGASVVRTVGDLFKAAQSQLGFGS
ncbi:hypothetical protein [Hahella sp. HN01]|uniref:hypothetical protein n=1 Tax=Hahella sp. HN01 TaxID=2847262 RepID=UPI001C1E983A|nr:hypothetical protein [Hahella sp. HN01]MBU6955584.1 hypothetical protein [Hahella sp. HN01]